MSKISQQDAAMFLTPGSVWLMEDGTASILLVITNGTLPKKVQEKCPPQAVYMDEQGNVFSRDVAQFLATRKFHNVIGTVETQVDALLAYRGDDVEGDDLSLVPEGDGDGDEIDSDDELTLEITDDEADGDDELTLEAFAQEIVADATPMPAASSAIVSFGAPDELLAAAAELSASVVGYSEEPILSHELIAHVIVIDPSKLKTLTTEDVIAMFDPDNEPILPSFAVRDTDPIVWETYIGAYRRVQGNKDFITLYLGSPAAVEHHALTGDDLDQAIMSQEVQLQQEAAAPVVEAAPKADPQPVPAAAAPVEQAAVVVG